MGLCLLPSCVFLPAVYQAGTRAAARCPRSGQYALRWTSQTGSSTAAASALSSRGASYAETTTSRFVLNIVVESVLALPPRPPRCCNGPGSRAGGYACAGEKCRKFVTRSCASYYGSLFRCFWKIGIIERVTKQENYEYGTARKSQPSPGCRPAASYGVFRTSTRGFIQDMCGMVPSVNRSVRFLLTCGHT